MTMGFARRFAVMSAMLALGLISTFAIAAIALLRADRASHSSTSIIVRDGTEAWLVNMHHSFGLTWVNCERLVPPLLNESPSIVDIPSWSIPPHRQWPAAGNPRVASLAVGWPAPLAVRQWWTTSISQTFPLRFDHDDGRDSLRRAASRFFDRDSNAHGFWLWRGVALNTGLLGLGWAALGWISLALWRGTSHGQQGNEPADKQQ